MITNLRLLGHHNDDRTLKKARKLNELARDAQSNSMLKFVSTGQSVAAKPAANAKDLKGEQSLADKETFQPDVNSIFLYLISVVPVQPKQRP